MREGETGLYVVPEHGEMGFDLCMMRTQRMTGYYRDPFLYAVFTRSKAVVNVDVEDPWHTGHQTKERWLTLRRSGVRLRCQPEGFIVSPPLDGAFRDALAEVAKNTTSTPV